MPLDSFDRLGLPRRFTLDRATLERAYLARSRLVHPDYHAAGSTADQSASLELSAAVNQAYNILRDPFTRADHLLGLEGGPSAAEHKQVPQAFLAEMLDLRERLEDAKSAGTRDTPAVSVLAEEFAARSDVILGEVAHRFAEYESLPPNDPKQVGIRTQVRGLLNAANYIRGLIRDLNAD